MCLFLPGEQLPLGNVCINRTPISLCQTSLLLYCFLLYCQLFLLVTFISPFKHTVPCGVMGYLRCSCHTWRCLPSFSGSWFWTNVSWTKLSPLFKKNRLYWRSRDAFTNVKLVMVQIGRGKDKTNRQLVPIMVLLGADGPVITGLETCNCTQLWVRSPSLERQWDECSLSQNSSSNDVCTLQQRKPRTSLTVSTGQRCAEAAAVTFPCGFIPRCKNIILGFKVFLFHGQWSRNHETAVSVTSLLKNLVKLNDDK